MADKEPSNVTVIGKHPVTGEPVTLEVDPCKQELARLRHEGIPLYEVGPLQSAATDIRRQASDLRDRAAELERKAGEYDALTSICGRRDMELAAKGMKLVNGRVVRVDGDRVRQS